MTKDNLIRSAMEAKYDTSFYLTFINFTSYLNL
jgi:hypothetical protein